MAREREEEEIMEYDASRQGRASDAESTDGRGNGIRQALLSKERAFEDKQVPSWRQQLTVRAFVVSFFLGIMISAISMKLNLTTGVVPSFNISAGLLGFFFVKSWSATLDKLGLLKQPFTRQENTVVQTCVVASTTIASSGGFGNYLFGMSDTVAQLTSTFNDPLNIKVPRIGWMIGFLFVVSFVGLFSVLPLRKILIIDYKLIYPTGTATAHLINSFHTPKGAKLAKKQVTVLGRFLCFSFLWGFFQWFYTAGDGCGFNNFPTFGLKAYKSTFYFDFQTTYVGIGMICPYNISVSALLGGIISWGLTWPLIENKKGDWYAADLPSPSSLEGLTGYQVFISISMILGDCIYNFVKIVVRTSHGFVQQVHRKRKTLPTTDDGQHGCTVVKASDERRRTELFLEDQIPAYIAVVGYVVISSISVVALPRIFPPLKWYYIFTAYIVAPILGFCNAYGCGLTGVSFAFSYGQLAIFIVGAWAGASNGGVLAGLAACGVVANIVFAASDLMTDFRTGYLTLTSPRSMFISQVIGTAMGCIISPCVFWFFYKVFSDLGQPDGEYPAPYALIYRNMAIVGVEGFDALPAHCLQLCYVFFAATVFICFLRDVIPKKISKFIPIPMAMAIPFYIGSYFTIDMTVGSGILFVWGLINKPQRDAFASAVASGLICGDGMWTFPQSVLALAKVKAPICMKFLSRADNARVDAFLSSS